MSVAVKSKIGHSYITSIKNICGGRAIIKGTRIPVWSIIKWYKTGMSIYECENKEYWKMYIKMQIGIRRSNRGSYPLKKINFKGLTPK